MNVAAWAATIVAGLAPRRFWPSLETHLPLRSAAAVSGVVTLAAGFALGVGGFLAFGTQLAAANNDWMLKRLAAAPAAGDAAVGLVPFGMSVMTLFIFIFFTLTGLISLYLVTSGTLRAISAGSTIRRTIRCSPHRLGGDDDVAEEPARAPADRAHPARRRRRAGCTAPWRVGRRSGDGLRSARGTKKSGMG